MSIFNEAKNDQFTVEVYKLDKRIKKNSKSIRWGKNKVGLRFVENIDFKGKTKEEIEVHCKNAFPKTAKFKTIIYETYVTRTHLMTNEKYQERYDTPNYCSPSSESYWSM